MKSLFLPSHSPFLAQLAHETSLSLQKPHERAPGSASATSSSAASRRARLFIVIQKADASEKAQRGSEKGTYFGNELTSWKDRTSTGSKYYTGLKCGAKKHFYGRAAAGPTFSEGILRTFTPLNQYGPLRGYISCSL